MNKAIILLILTLLSTYCKGQNKEEVDLYKETIGCLAKILKSADGNKPFFLIRSNLIKNPDDIELWKKDLSHLDLPFDEHERFKSMGIEQFPNIVFEKNKKYLCQVDTVKTHMHEFLTNFEDSLKIKNNTGSVYYFVFSDIFCYKNLYLLNIVYYTANRIFGVKFVFKKKRKKYFMVGKGMYSL